MNNYLPVLIVFIALTASVNAQYEDVRCKCVCPSVQQQGPNNTTIPSRKVFLRTFNEPGNCNCRNVVDKSILETEDVSNFCNRCECQWQRRNTTTIKVVVILIICIVAMLFLYMLFLLCLDPLMSRRPKTYQEQHNEEDTQSVQPGGMLEEGGPRPRGVIISRVRNEVSRVRGEQQKWKGTVQEQRKNIFDRHTMLN